MIIIVKYIFIYRQNWGAGGFLLVGAGGFHYNYTKNAKKRE
jgi:hypothetical protein